MDFEYRLTVNTETTPKLLRYLQVKYTTSIWFNKLTYNKLRFVKMNLLSKEMRFTRKSSLNPRCKDKSNSFRN